MMIDEPGNLLPVGVRRHTVPVPPVEEHTLFIEAGPVLFGVEYRILNDDILDAHLAKDQAAFAAHWAVRADRVVPHGQVSDEGVSVHVFDSADRREYLRFDDFDDLRHYHYVLATGGHIAVAFDTEADPDFAGWILERLKTRLPHMLRRSGADELAARVDAAAVEAVLPDVERAMAIVRAG